MTQDRLAALRLELDGASLVASHASMYGERYTPAQLDAIYARHERLHRAVKNASSPREMAG